MCYSALVKKDLHFLGREYGATVIRDQVSTFEQLSLADPKKYPPLRTRIFPGNYAPVIYKEGPSRVIRLMRYGAHPPPTIPHPERYTTYNARRDNLWSPFWADAFMQHHGFVVLLGMYEWVLVKDLLSAGVVSLDRILAYFDNQKQARRAKIMAAGKKYKPTSTELKAPLDRRIIIEFKPEHSGSLLVPVIFSAYKTANGVDGYGFAIVTDEPPPEVARAGHDRCPIILQPGALDTWLSPSRLPVHDVSHALQVRDRVVFLHDLEPQTAS